MNDTGTVLLFSYGTLQQEDVQMASFGRRLSGRSDAMPGYRQSMLEITDPEVIRTRGKRFHPVVSASGDPQDEVSGTRCSRSRRPNLRLPTSTRSPTTSALPCV